MKTLNNFGIACLLFFLGGCFNPEDYESPDPGKIVWFVSGDTTVAADASSSAKIVAQISPDAAPERRKVVFKTSSGSFKNGSGDSVVVEANKDFQATAYLTSIKTLTSEVSIKARSVKSDVTRKIEFTKAYPDKIAVTVDSFAIENNFKSEVLITASLSLNNGGKPSVGHRVNFKATDQGGHDLGHFLNGQDFAFTGADGKTSIRYSAGETSYKGPLTITAVTATSDGTSINHATIIYLTN